MTTFSQLVDSIVSETKRPDLVSEIATYLNQTIREVHFTPDRGAALFFSENFRESLLTATSDESYTWDIPNPGTFQKMLLVKYSSLFDRQGNDVFAAETIPGRHLAALDYYFYRVGGTFVFSGFGGLNSQIAIGWYEFPPSLKYKTPALREAWYDSEIGWEYHPDVNTPELQAAAQILTTNWLLMRWHDVIAEGVRAKVYKRLSDTERARTSYSLYGSLRQGLWTSETAETGYS
jgi:hypothetical protein